MTAATDVDLTPAPGVITVFSDIWCSFAHIAIHRLHATRTSLGLEDRVELPRGYIGPDFHGATFVVADPLVGEERGWITGANEHDHHVRHAVLGRDFRVDLWAGLVSVVTGDPCPRCGSPLSVDRGIEVGHVFQLGTKYSDALGATVQDQDGKDCAMAMGCYGIGVTRIVGAAIEQNPDEREQEVSWLDGDREPMGQGGEGLHGVLRSGVRAGRSAGSARVAWRRAGR